MSNLEIWKKNAKPNKAMVNHNDNGLASVQAYYLFEQATKQFGPIGKGWGYNIEEIKTLEGIPIYSPGPGETHLLEMACLVQIKLWYMSGEDRVEMPPLSGTAKYIYFDVNLGFAVTNFDAERVALTNAIKKSLSMLGFAADVYMGKHNEELVTEQPEPITPSPSKTAANDEAQQEKEQIKQDLFSQIDAKMPGILDCGGVIRQGAVTNLKTDITKQCHENHLPVDQFLNYIDQKAA